MTARPESPEPASGIEPWAPDPAIAPDRIRTPSRPASSSPPRTTSRLHFLDWGRRSATRRRAPWRYAAPAGPAPAGVVVGAGGATPGAGRRPSSSPTCAGRACRTPRWTGYDLDTLAADAVAVAEGPGCCGERPIVVAGHGFGGDRRGSPRPRRSGERCAGLVLVDGGWERLESTTGVDVDEFLRGLDEPPEVLRSMDACLADRRGLRPGDAGTPTRSGRPGTPSSRPPPATSSGRSGRTSSRRSSARCSRRTRRACWPPSRRRSSRWSRSGAGDDERPARGAAPRARTARASAGRRPIRLAGFPGAAPQPDALPAGRGHGRDPRGIDGRRVRRAAPAALARIAGHARRLLARCISPTTS